MEASMNADQLKVVETICRAVDSAKKTRRAKGYCYYLDGPGGTGKTYTYIAIYHKLRGKGIKVACVASTGIAAILLPDGRTAHTVFGLAVPLIHTSVSKVKPGTNAGEFLKGIDVIIWDEAPMNPKYALQNVDEVLQLIMKNKLPFGGKVMLLGGDFRQCLPVKKGATMDDKIRLSIKHAPQWKHFDQLHLQINERVRKAKQLGNVDEIEEQERFAKWVLDVSILLNKYHC